MPLYREAVVHRSPGSAAVTPRHPGNIGDHPRSHPAGVPHTALGCATPSALTGIICPQPRVTLRGCAAAQPLGYDG
jgi:hypothetical protein